MVRWWLPQYLEPSVGKQGRRTWAARAECGVKSGDYTACVLTGLEPRGCTRDRPSMRGNHVVFEAISTTCLLLLLLLTNFVSLHSSFAVQSSSQRSTTLQMLRLETCMPGPWAAPTTRIQISTLEIRFAGRRMRSPHTAPVPGHTQHTQPAPRASFLAHASHDSRASAEEGRPTPRHQIATRLRDCPPPMELSPENPASFVGRPGQPGPAGPGA